MRDFGPSQLRAFLESTTHAALLLDVREPWEFAICSLPDSQLLPMRHIPAAVQNRSLPDNRDIVVICHHGIRSRQVAMFLEHQGYSSVINLRGGIDAWARDLDPAMATY
jgi:rhodanese-related sulfurtransferase